jgi:hypothetical protein
VETELELGNHTEVAASAAESPEQVVVLRLADPQRRAVSRDSFVGHDCVTSQAESSCQPAHAPPSVRPPTPVWETLPAVVANRRPVPLGPGRPARRHPAPTARRASGSIRTERHSRKVDQQSAVRHANNQDAVTAAPDARFPDRAGASEVDRSRHIFATGALHRHRWTTVHHGVPDTAARVVADVSSSITCPATRSRSWRTSTWSVLLVIELITTIQSATAVGPQRKRHSRHHPERLGWSRELIAPAGNRPLAC